MYGERLKSLRKERRWIIDDVASLLEVGRSTYASYESEHRNPPIDVLLKLSEIFDVSIDYILGVTDDADVKQTESNAYAYLKKSNLNWNGVPLSDDELKPIRDLLEVVVRGRSKE